jgi:glutamine synthetase
VRERELLDRGIELLAIAFVDGAGITRAKSVPAARAEAVALRGVGSPFAFAIFQGNDGMATSTGYEATGDTRLVPDMARLAGPVDGWGWTAGDLREQDGRPWDFCTRSFLKRMAARLDASGLSMRMAYELEWYAERDDGRPAHSTPAYSLNATAEAGAYLREVARRAAALGVGIEQLHPEYSAGQMEVSLGALEPVAAADACVAAKHAIRTAWQATGIRASFAPIARPDGLGNGCHLHFSLWRGEQNLMAPAEEPGPAGQGRAFTAGVLRELPALMALGCACPISYRRMLPNRWTGAYVCWGTENREAPLRFIPGAAAAGRGAANAELKAVDGSGNPYLLAGAVIAAGLAGVADGAELAEEVLIEPSRVAAELRLDRLPETLPQAAERLAGSGVLREALGERLHDALVAVRNGEAAAAGELDEAALFDFYRWRY